MAKGRVSPPAFLSSRVEPCVSRYVIQPNGLRMASSEICETLGEWSPRPTPSANRIVLDRPPEPARLFPRRTDLSCQSRSSSRPRVKCEFSHRRREAASTSQAAATSATAARSKASSPSRASTRIVSPSPKRPSRSAAASGFSTSRWSARFSGRAP